MRLWKEFKVISKGRAIELLGSGKEILGIKEGIIDEVVEFKEDLEKYKLFVIKDPNKNRGSIVCNNCCRLLDNEEVFYVSFNYHLCAGCYRAF